jgi:HTH-type transcriptional regulator / antitoxin HipB
MSSFTPIWTASDLGLVLRERRRQLGLTQQALADRVGVSRPWIVQVEGGKPGAELGLVLRTARELGLHLRLEPAAQGVSGQANVVLEGATLSAMGTVRDRPPQGLDVDLDAIIDDARGSR